MSLELIKIDPKDEGTFGQALDYKINLKKTLEYYRDEKTSDATDQRKINNILRLLYPLALGTPAMISLFAAVWKINIGDSIFFWKDSLNEFALKELNKACGTTTTKASFGDELRGACIKHKISDDAINARIKEISEYAAPSTTEAPLKTSQVVTRHHFLPAPREIDRQHLLRDEYEGSNYCS